MENEKINDADQQAAYNRKNVNSIKRMLIVTFLIMCALPILFCLYLMVRMNGMEKKIDAIADKVSMKQQEQEELARAGASDDMLELDQESYEDLTKNTAVGGEYLTQTEDGTPVGTESQEGSISKDLPGTGKKVYLTFDDGPSEYTNEILDILAANDVKATFFVIYNEDQSLWPAYQRIVDEGHTLAMHSYSHVYNSVYASLDSFKKDVSDIHDFLYEQTGVDCKYYRFPGGSSNTVANVDIQELMGYLYSEGITYFDWNALSGDAGSGYVTSELLNSTILGYVRGNEEDSIVLMHDLSTRHETIEGLQELIDTLKAEGYELCAIDDNTPLIQHVSYDGAAAE